MNNEFELISVAHAQEPGAPAPGGGGGLLSSPLLFMLALLLIMYALLIRPQQKQQKEHKAMLAQVKRGDQIVTNGGIHGRVTGVTDDILTVEIAERVRVKLNKSAVANRSSTSEEEGKS